MARHDDPEEAYPVGSDVSCVVTHVEDFGIFVKVEDPPEGPISGFIRPRDWSWSRRIFDLAATVRPGERTAARVTALRKDGQLELSRRLTLPDPYPRFRSEHGLGDAVLCQVSLVAPQEKGIVVSLVETDGVEGFVPGSEVPDTGDREGFGLLARDLVAATILRFQKDRVVLSITEYLRHRDDGLEETTDSGAMRFHPSLGPTLESLQLDLRLGEIDEPRIDPLVREEVRQILIVEDSGNVSDSLEMVFRHLGFGCDHAESLDEAVRLLDGNPYDLLILDVNLPSENGAELLSRLRGEKGPAFVFVLTATAAADWARLVEEKGDRVTGFFQKPTSVGRLLEQLARHLRNEVPHDDRVHAAGLDATAQPELRPTAGTGWTRRIEEQLRGLQRTTQASQVFVLAFRPGPSFELVAGKFVPLGREVAQELDISPIGDVLRQRRYLYVPDVGDQAARFKHLLQVVPAGSFAGHPLTHSDQAEYGLFLLGKRPGQLQRITEERLRVAAMLVGHDIAEQRLDAVITENQGLLLTGFLSDSLLHEIKNELQALDDYAAVQLLLAKERREDLRQLRDEELLELKRSILGMQGVSKRLNELVVLFRNLAGRPRQEVIDLNQTLDRLQKTVKPFADGHSVFIETDYDPAVPGLRISPKMVDQPLLNIMINGVEQMSRAGGRRKRLTLATHYVPGADFPVRITVADNGRGIHFVHQEKIFDLFFTTKERGTGLGLYISRFFIERLGGRLSLESSVMFAGTEFLIELPQSAVS